MTLLLGPPSAGKTTLLLALAGKLDSDLKVRTFGVALNQTKMPLFGGVVLGCFCHDAITVKS
jgi:ABC-type multidrug transport system ATPase subunit